MRNLLYLTETGRFRKSIKFDKRHSSSGIVGLTQLDGIRIDFISQLWDINHNYFFDDSIISIPPFRSRFNLLFIFLLFSFSNKSKIRKALGQRAQTSHKYLRQLISDARRRKTVKKLKKMGEGGRENLGNYTFGGAGLQRKFNSLFVYICLFCLTVPQRLSPT